MSMSEEFRQNVGEFTASSEYNALHFIITSIIKGLVNTAIPVRVDAIERPGTGGGARYLSATPLVKMRSAAGDALESVSIPKLRWFRLQHGKAAIVVDPKPGDIGLAVFAQQDVSALNGGNEPVQPGSFRAYDMSDGFYIGGFFGPPPTTFVHIEDSGDIVITGPKNVTVNTTNATVNASGQTTINTPTTTITGDLTVVGHITGTGGMAISGGSGASVTGSMTVTDDVTAGGISLMTHTHSGVQPGGGSTGQPQ